MSNIKVNEYVLKDPRFNKDRTVVNMSDIHSNVVALNNIVKLLEEIKASYIYVPGDTLDSIDNPHNKEIMELLKKVGNISQTFLSVGNHEMCELSYETGKKEEVESKDYIDFFIEVAKQTDCIPMISDFSKIDLADDLSVSAANVPFSYYGKKENLEQYKKLLENVKEKMDDIQFNNLYIIRIMSEFNPYYSSLINFTVKINSCIMKFNNMLYNSKTESCSTSFL